MIPTQEDCAERLRCCQLKSVGLENAIDFLWLCVEVAAVELKEWRQTSATVSDIILDLHDRAEKVQAERERAAAEKETDHDGGDGNE